MSDRKIEMNFVESSIIKHATFSKCLDGVLKEAAALARLPNVKADVLIISPAGQLYVFQNPCQNSVVGHIQSHKPRRGISHSSLKQARIIKSQAKLNRLMEKLEREKERAKVLKKRQQKSIEKRKKIKDMKLEELIVFKTNLETLREKIKGILMEGETSLSVSVDTLKEQEKKNKI